jgi:hypothetical protein
MVSSGPSSIGHGECVEGLSSGEERSRRLVRELSDAAPGQKCYYKSSLMMRRSRWTRPFAALFAVWFALMLGDPGTLHSCPMHGGHGGHGGAPAAAATASGHGAHGAHAMHDVASADAMSHDGAQHHGKTGPCTCMGQCCAASILAPLPAVAALHVPVTVARVEQPLLVAVGDAPASPDLRLPFANGPPVIA